MNWQEFTALLVLATAMSFSPGPNTTLSTALAANGGLPRAMRFVVAVPVGWTLLQREGQQHTRVQRDLRVIGKGRRWDSAVAEA